MASLTPAQIQGQVRLVRKRLRNGASAFALRYPDFWPGPDRLEVDGEEHLVFGCGSDLEAREILGRAEAEGKPVVLLCRVGADAFGEDLLARFAKQRVVQAHAAEMVAALFAAREVDPRVTGCKPLLESLLRDEPQEGYRPSTTGLLDLDQAWGALLRARLGVEMETPGPGPFLRWMADPAKARALAGMEPALRTALQEWYCRTAGESVRHMMSAMENGLAEDLLPLGFALGLVFSPEVRETPDFRAALARTEPWFSRNEIDAGAARAWHQAAREFFASWGDALDEVEPKRCLKRLDQLIVDLKLQGMASASPHALLGLNARFARVGRGLERAVREPGESSLREVDGALELVDHHALARSRRPQVERARMAQRLVRWLAQPASPAAPAGLPRGAEFFARDGGFLDWARQCLREAGGEDPLQGVYRSLLQRVEERLLPLESAFAGALADWTRENQTSPDLIPIEDVLARVVVPAVRQQPVLLLVLDGMSMEVFRRLLRDIEKRDWSEVRHPGLGIPRPVLAAIPSVTEVSRRALFLGRLDAGQGGEEPAAFEANDALHHAGGGARRPRLFRKGELEDSSRSGLSEALTQALLDPQQRLVGAVVNAVDDHLSGGDQVRMDWGVDLIRPLPQLLSLAEQSKRLVILTSDHGHVMDFGTEYIAQAGEKAGDRHREPGAPVREGEIQVEGPRVLAATRRKNVVLAWRADVRYSAKKRGYHGGANPREMVVPLAILNPSSSAVPAGWLETPSYEPAWWNEDGQPAPVATTRKAGRAPQPARPMAGTEPELFTLEPTPPASAWIEALLKSPVFRDQCGRAAGQVPAAPMVVQVLELLAARGGKTLKPVLAQAAGIPLYRVDGLVQRLGRILNLDGYEVIALDRVSDTVSLNLDLLQTQFEIRIR